jgi:hypothetical protein
MEQWQQQLCGVESRRIFSGAPSQIIQAQQFLQLCAATQYLCGWLSSSQSTSSTLCMPAILEIMSTKRSEVKLMGH